MIHHNSFILADLVPSTSYLPAPSSSHLVMLSSVTLPSSIFSPSPTPSAASYHSDTNGGTQLFEVARGL